jgi:hypothetical protein
MNRFLILAAVLWSACGLRVLLDGAAGHRAPLPLRVPFAECPMDVVGPGWQGEDVPLEEDVRERAGVSAYLQRRYRWNQHSLWLYVGYVSGPAPNAIHHPAVCFPASGLELQSKKAVEIPVPGVPETPRFHEYLWTHPEGGSTYTLSTFHYHGRFEPAELPLRAALALGLGYFAVITVTAEVTASVEETRGLVADVIRRALPRLVLHFPPGEAP